MPKTGAGNRAVNVSIPADLLDAARMHKINLSAALKATLEQQIRERRREDWLRENAAAIKAYNRDVEQHGTFGDELRSF
jgi:antitoxin CcdA